MWVTYFRSSKWNANDTYLKSQKMEGNCIKIWERRNYNLNDVNNSKLNN